MNQSNWTGRTSRTMTEAFGAHCNDLISESHTPMPRADKLFCWVVGAIGVVAVTLMVAGVV